MKRQIVLLTLALLATTATAFCMKKPSNESCPFELESYSDTEEVPYTYEQYLRDYDRDAKKMPLTLLGGRMSREEFINFYKREKQINLDKRAGEKPEEEGELDERE